MPNHLLKDATIPAVETEEWNFSSVGTLSPTVDVDVSLFNIETGVGEGDTTFPITYHIHRNSKAQTFIN